jgi:hypothetical protein
MAFSFAGFYKSPDLKMKKPQAFYLRLLISLNISTKQADEQ